MVIERFRKGRTKEIYFRARERGRLLPDGLRYVDSWISLELDMCFQLMECDDSDLLYEWFRKWEDLAEFELIPVVSSAEASAMVLDRGDPEER